jgi:predicted Rossmann-fold nucleotide-binding protein
MTLPAKPTLTIFASDKGPGDAERSSIMSQTGAYLARRGARVLCLAERGTIPVPLITAARAAGGEVAIIADASIILPPALTGVPIEVRPDAGERLARIADETDAFVGLPGSMASVSSLFAAWTAARAGGHELPVVLLNRHRAFEVLRGYSADVLSHGLKGYDRMIQFADSIEDLWIRVARMIGERNERPFI